MNRNYLIPLSMIGLGLTTACTPPVVGDWELTQVTYGGETMSYPMEGSYTYEGVTYTYSYSGVMSMDKEGAAKFTTTSEYSDADGNLQTDSYDYNGTWVKNDDKSYGIDFEGEDMDMTCTVTDKTQLDCSVGANDVTAVFSAVED
ncbi:MAG: hypothetical protein JXX28_00495 [Deltaproteobacteria bacterium]|nr:hypothetical protein [Deltaproteobacteria bacterium]